MSPGSFKTFPPRSFPPATLRAMAQAFDEAWAAIAGNFGDVDREAARAKLADALLAVAIADRPDPRQLTDAALALMARRYRSRRDTRHHP